MNPLTEWQTFCEIAGSAAAALTGLQFVAIALIADVPHRSGEQGVEAFTNPTVVHFATALVLAASLAVPWHNLAPAAIAWGLVGLSGLLYVLFIAWSMQRQKAYKLVFEDWLFHAALPLADYIGLLAAAAATRAHTRGALFGLAGAILLLLVIGIHNSWDNLTYLVSMRRKAAERARTATAADTTAVPRPSPAPAE